MKNILLFLLFLIGGIAHAQERVVSGQVTSSNGSESLPGVSILLKGTNNGVVTDLNGKFSIAVPNEESVLVFSFVGYTTEEVMVGNRTLFNVNLAEDLKQLQEIVVVGYGTQTKATVSSAISSVKSSEITQTPVLRVEQALQGRVAGVQVSNISGQPGDAPTVRIRGAGTNGNSNPLYIVDGFPVGGIDFLNPGDIESIDVLKDAASAAIYGARGANGVVLITTKSAKRNEGFRVTIDSYYGVQNPWKKMSVLNAREYAIMMNEGAANGGFNLPFDNPSQFGQGTDWQDALFNYNAPISNHSVNISGSSAKTSYSSTFSYFNQEGIVGGDKSQFERFTYRLNTDTKVSERLKLTSNIAYTHINRRAINPNQEFGGLLGNAINLDPITPVFENDPNRIANMNANAVRSGGRYYGISQYATQEIVNPLARLEVTNARTKVDKLVGNAMASYEFFKGFSLVSTYGIDLAFVHNENFNPIFYLNAAQVNNNSLVSGGFDKHFTWQTENFLKYENTFGKSSINAVVGTTALKYRGDNLFGSNTGLVTDNPRYAYLNMAVDRGSERAVGGAGEHSLLSHFGRVNFTYANKFLLTGTVRRDGSSRFGPENKFAVFPSASAGYVISEEAFLRNNPVISFLKARASWGQNGNEAIPDFQYLSAIGVGRGYTFVNSEGNPYYISGAVPSNISNPFLRWETSEQTNFGIDMGFFNDALSFTMDYYIKSTKDLLVRAPIPALVGNEAPFVNGGSVRNSGVEVALHYQGKISDVRFTTGFNMAYNVNKVTSLENAEGLLLGARFATYGDISRAEVGYPIGFFHGLKTNGIFQNQAEVEAHVNSNGQLLQPAAKPGDVRFLDLNKNGVIDDGDRTMIGNPTPKYTLGFDLGADYKRFDFRLFLNGALGHQIFNGTRRHDLVMSNMHVNYLNRWTGEGSTNEMPRFTWADNNGNYSKVSDLYIEDGSWIRLRNVQIGYTFPEVTRKFRSLRVYASGDNILTFTKYSGLDPEIGARSSLDIGVDRGVYPQARTYRLGVNLTF
jgi:TonB-dependent starch-binding outer membrane protein SusC